MLTNYLVLDVATSALPNAAEYLDGTVKAPANYKDEAKIADYIREKEAERLHMAACDVDLSRVIGFGLLDPGNAHDGGDVVVAENDPEETERLVLREILGPSIRRGFALVTFGGFNFDLPMLTRRARYLGVPFPAINIDRFKSPHLDLCELLSDRNPQRRRSLQFYVKRMGWTDITKPLSGADEARVPETGLWGELAESIRHDITATYRLACWLGLIEPVTQPTLPETEVVF